MIRSIERDKVAGKKRKRLMINKNRIIIEMNVRAYVPVLSSSGHHHWGTDIRCGR